jgi:hypothetical protein
MGIAKIRVYGVPMNDIEHFRAMAQNLRRQAELTPNSAIRDHLIEIAEQYQRLAQPRLISDGQPITANLRRDRSQLADMKNS